MNNYKKKQIFEHQGTHLIYVSKSPEGTAEELIIAEKKMKSYAFDIWKLNKLPKRS